MKLLNIKREIDDLVLTKVKKNEEDFRIITDKYVEHLLSKNRSVHNYIKNNTIDEAEYPFLMYQFINIQVFTLQNSKEVDNIYINTFRIEHIDKTQSIISELSSIISELRKNRCVVHVNFYVLIFLVYLYIRVSTLRLLLDDLLPNLNKNNHHNLKRGTNIPAKEVKNLKRLIKKRELSEEELNKRYSTNYSLFLSDIGNEIIELSSNESELDIMEDLFSNGNKCRKILKEYMLKAIFFDVDIENVNDKKISLFPLVEKLRTIFSGKDIYSTQNIDLEAYGSIKNFKVKKVDNFFYL